MSMKCKVCNKLRSYAYGYCWKHWCYYYRVYIRPLMRKCRFCKELYRRVSESAEHGRDVCLVRSHPAPMSRMPYVPELEE